MTENPRFQLTFLGAAQVVTGSSYLLEIFDHEEMLATLMIDHGMFQGVDDEYLNYRDYSFSPASVDYLLLTHAHVDHCGLIPKLVKHGFDGRILATQQTFELCELILLDSAKIQDSRLQREGIEPLYDANDVMRALSLFEVVEIGEEYELDIDNNRSQSGRGNTLQSSSRIKIVPMRAGHILGAASYHISYRNKSIVFSGDLGRRSQLVVKPYGPIEYKTDFVVMESLYGGKKHEDFEDVKKHFADVVNQTLARNGNVIIPAFSVQRSQEMLLLLSDYIKKGIIDKNVQFFFDSPLAINVTKVYTSNPTELSEDISSEEKVRSRLFISNVKVVTNSKKFKKVAKGKKQIILTGGGMCNGGRIVEYLKAELRNANDTITLIGYQAEGTLGRELAEGKKRVTIDGESYDVKANIEIFRGFSAHGDYDDLLGWLDVIARRGINTIYLIHAEVEQSLPFKSALEKLGYKVEVPGIGDKVIL